MSRETTYQYEARQRAIQAHERRQRERITRSVEQCRQQLDSEDFEVFRECLPSDIQKIRDMLTKAEKRQGLGMAKEYARRARVAIIGLPTTLSRARRHNEAVRQGLERQRAKAQAKHLAELTAEHHRRILALTDPIVRDFALVHLAAVEAQLAGLATQDKAIAKARLDRAWDGVIHQAQADAQAWRTRLMAEPEMAALVAQDEAEEQAEDARIAQQVEEDVRREVVTDLIRTLHDTGFIVDPPRRTVNGDLDEVHITARRASGSRARFKVNLDGTLFSAFELYQGTACKQDAQAVFERLQQAYGIELSDERILAEVPDRLTTDARPLPQGHKPHDR